MFLGDYFLTLTFNEDTYVSHFLLFVGSAQCLYAAKQWGLDSQVGNTWLLSENTLNIDFVDPFFPVMGKEKQIKKGQNIVQARTSAI